MSTISEDSKATQPTNNDSQQTYPWCKVFIDKATSPCGQDYCFMNLTTNERMEKEPGEQFWLWDYTNQAVHVSGLQQPTDPKILAEEAEEADDQTAPLHYDEPKPKTFAYQGYNPRVHGSYDATKYYDAWHQWLKYSERLASSSSAQQAQQAQENADYRAAAGFNSRTGGFQREDVTAERHNDYNKSGRQMEAFFDAQAAANMNDGKSLKAERQAVKYSKEEIKEMNAKRKEKKNAKRMAFLKS
ncbi:hypothetical protein LTR95_017800 [Oleoguttula sp. CCFEE 5521]